MSVNKEFYGVSQSNELPGFKVREHKGVVWGSHLAGAQYGYDLTRSFADKAEALGANAVVDIKATASDKYFLFTGTAVVVEPDGM